MLNKFFIIDLTKIKDLTMLNTLVKPSSILPMYISKASAARILGVNVNKITRIRIYQGKVIAQYFFNKGKCCSFISFKAFKNDFLKLRLDAHIKHQYEITQYNDLNDLNGYRAVVKYASSHDSHLVQIEDQKYSCDCQDFIKQKELGNGFTVPVCKHLKPVALSFGFKTFSECVASTKLVKTAVGV